MNSPAHLAALEISRMIDLESFTNAPDDISKIEAIIESHYTIPMMSAALMLLESEIENSRVVRA